MIGQIKNVEPISREMAEIVFKSNNSDAICDALIRITFHDYDYVWVQGKCIDFLSSNDLDVKRLAIICLGHLARIHEKIDKEKVIPLLKSIRENKNLEGAVDDALDDINMFAQ